MTKKIDAKVVAQAIDDRRTHATFRIREDLLKRVREESNRLNCSRGVYFEILLQKTWKAGLISIADVFQYDPTIEWVSQVLGMDIKPILKEETNPIIPTYMRRVHSTFLIRESYLRKARNECIRLNCSTGVYIELLLKKSGIRNP